MITYTCPYLDKDMDTFFQLGVQERNDLLLSLMESLGATYICLWSYYPQPNNCLVFFDGRHQEESNQPSSSSGSSLARGLFGEYRQLCFLVANDRVPGSAFLTNRPYMEATQVELQRMAHCEMQRLFYREARIKTAVFMGCRSGEIEFGWSTVTQTTNLQNEMRNWFPEDFLRVQSPLRELPQAVDPNRHSSSSSSLISLSMDSPDCSSLTFNVNPSASHLPDHQAVQIQDTLTVQPLVLPVRPVGINFQLQQTIQSSQSPLIITGASSSPLHEAIQHLQAIPSTSNPPQVAQALTASASTSTQQQQLPISPFPLTRESVDAAMTRAMLAILSSPSSTSSSSQAEPPVRPGRPSAFKSYNLGLGPRSAPARPGSGRNTSLIKRATAYYRRFYAMTRRDHMHMVAANRPTSTQLHHMISERKRREKINESFQALRSLLPPDSKKDKASVLSRTRDYLCKLRAQVAELIKRKEELEAQLLRVREGVQEVTKLSSGQRLAVRVANVPESSTSDEQRLVDVQIFLRAQYPISDMVIRILEFLKLDSNVNLLSVEASTFVVESASINRVTLRLRIEGNEWDESTFQEAVRRVLADLAR